MNSLKQNLNPSKNTKIINVRKAWYDGLHLRISAGCSIIVGGIMISNPGTTELKMVWDENTQTIDRKMRELFDGVEPGQSED